MRYGTETKLSPEEVLVRARTLFVAGGEIGLMEAPAGPEGVAFAGPDGGVGVSVHRHDGMTEEAILSRQDDDWAERFVRVLP